MIELTKSVDGEPLLIAADQIARVHGRRAPDGRLFCEVYPVGGKKAIGLVERVDQVRAALAAAGVKTYPAAVAALARSTSPDANQEQA